MKVVLDNIVQKMNALKQKENMAVNVAWNNAIDKCIRVAEDGMNEPDWVPCSVDTPKEGGIYLVTCHTGTKACVTKAMWRPKVKDWRMSGVRLYWKVVAWKKLPEPYMGVE